MKVLLNTVYYLFVACVVAVALMSLTTHVSIPGNLQIKVVKSGSMEPYIKTGGVVVIRPAPDYKVGDVVTFGKDTKDQIPTTHRIMAIEGEGPLRTFTTKGDANDSEDPALQRLSDIRGKVLFTLPYLGYILDFAKKPIGFVLLVGFPALVIIVDEVGKIIKEIKTMRKRKLNVYKAEGTKENNSSN
jgi:signal peptidase